MSHDVLIKEYQTIQDEVSDLKAQFEEIQKEIIKKELLLGHYRSILGISTNDYCVQEETDLYIETPNITPPHPTPYGSYDNSLLLQKMKNSLRRRT